MALQNKFSQISQTFVEVAKLNPCEEILKSDFAKLNPRIRNNYTLYKVLFQFFIKRMVM